MKEVKLSLPSWWVIVRWFLVVQWFLTLLPLITWAALGALHIVLSYGAVWLLYVFLYALAFSYALIEYILDRGTTPEEKEAAKRAAGMQKTK